ncbi:MAG: DUF3386 family protein [Pirellulaceae bacterium]
MSQAEEHRSEKSAQQLRRAAHDARAVWEQFPGFSAQINISTDSQSHSGEIIVADDFTYELKIADVAIQPWVNSKLRSVISHRKPGEAREYAVRLADQDATHAAGRLVEHTDGSGVFRIEDDLIREVHRKSDSAWFEISTLETEVTSEGKHLPRSTSVTYRDPKTGDIESNLSNRFSWIKVGDFHLPAEAYTVEVANGGERSVRKITFTDHRLTAAKVQLSERSALHKPLPNGLTSFGAAVLENYLYVFSGHDGDAHGFGRDQLSDHFRRIQFDDPSADWEELAKHEPAQSTALLTDGTYLYRIGGLTFRNSGSDMTTNFESTDHFSRYDVQKNEWTELAPLPEPRSSLDAALIGRSIYVAGGWNLQGESSSDAPWHEDILRFNLDEPEKGWQSLPGPGYITRAAAVAEHDGKLALIGGIQQRGITRKVSFYDPEANSWTEGPELPQDSGAAGFANSAFALNGHLYTSGGSGVLYRLSDDGESWQIEDRLLFPRMFLRLLPTSDDRLLAVGGTASFGGRMGAVESIRVGQGSQDPKLVQWSVPFDGQVKQSQTLALAGGVLYAMGGNATREPHNFAKESFVDEAFAFHIPNQTVEKLPNLPHPLQSGAAVAQSQTSEHRRIHVLGGLGFDEGKFGSLDQVFSLDPESKTWTTAPVSLPSARGMFTAITHDDAIWAFGGSDAGGGRGLASNVLHWWGDETPIAPLKDITLPTPRRSFGGAAIGDEFFLVGGLTAETGIAETVDVFHLKDRTWRQIAAPHKARVFPSVTADGDKLYLFGGFSQVDGHFAPEPSLEVYDAEQDRWRVVADELPGISPSMAMFSFSGRLLFYGIDREVDGQANFAIYDPEPLAQPSTPEDSGRGRRGGESLRSAQALMRKDVDKDGKLSAEELGSRLGSLLETGDADQDGLLTQDELEAALKQQEEKEPEAADED